jgi:hypothetical protein
LINALTISGFKGFAELELPQLSRITLLGGRNNAGKTSVLEALFTLFDRLNPQMMLRQYGWRNVETLPLDPASVWSPFFTGYDLSRDIWMLAVINGRRERMTLRFNPQYRQQIIAAEPPLPGSHTPVIQTGSPVGTTASLDIHYQIEGLPEQLSHITLRGNTLQYTAENVDIFSTHLVAIIGTRIPESQNELATRFGQLDVVGRQDVVVDFLRIMEPDLKSLTVIATGNLSMVYGDVGLRRKIPISYMGDGMYRLLTIITYMATMPGGILLIDEVENGIHHSVMAQVWAAIAAASREFDCQVIATSHSYECLQAAVQGLEGESEQDFSYIRLDKRANHVTAKRFDYRLLEAALASNLEVR